MKIAIDFDGSAVTHEYPNVGKDIGAVPVLKALVDKGHQLILYTMRSDSDAQQRNGEAVGNNHTLTDAVNWFKENGIKLYGVQKDPTQHLWTSSNKCYANLYIDDAALGCPLVYAPSISNRAFVDWIKVEKMLKDNKIL